MVALVLWYVLGWHAGAAEVLVELALGLLIYGGGRRRRDRQIVAYELRRRVVRLAG